MQARDGFLDSMENGDILKDLPKAPFKNARRYYVCYVNGYRFHTISHSSNKESTENSWVCVKSDDNSPDETKFYGKLEDTIELEYRALPIKRVTLFQFQWYDNMAMVRESIHNKSWLMFILVDRIESTILLYWQVKLSKFII